MSALMDEFLAAAAPDVYQAGPALEASLATLRSRGQAAWPQLEVGEAALGRDLGTRVGDKQRQLETLHAADLHLAAACALGEARAQAQLDKLLPEACAALPGETAGARGAFSDEVRQLLRQKLLVATEEGPARIAGYSGEGALKSWLRVAAVRTALSLRRRDGREEQADDRALEALASSDQGPELDYLRVRTGAEFRRSFQDALAGLTPRDRTLLKLYYLDGLGVERIGAVYAVHASTASRWLSTVRETLLVETRRELAERLKLTSTEVESMLGLIRSQLEVSLQRILTPSDG